jgi:hypothetical protein
MAARKGTEAFTTKESDGSEKLARRIFNEILSEPEYSRFSTEKSYSMNEIYGTDLSVTEVHGGDCVTEPDLGLLMLDGIPIGVGENKYQTKFANACERVNLYTVDAQAMGFNQKNVLIILDGPAFNKNKEGRYMSAPGKQVVRSKRFNTCLVQPTEKELYTGIRGYLDRILREEST